MLLLSLIPFYCKEVLPAFQNINMLLLSTEFGDAVNRLAPFQNINMLLLSLTGLYRPTRTILISKHQHVTIIHMETRWQTALREISKHQHVTIIRSDGAVDPLKPDTFQNINMLLLSLPTCLSSAPAVRISKHQHVTIIRLICIGAAEGFMYFKTSTCYYYPQSPVNLPYFVANFKTSTCYYYPTTR